MSVVPFPLRAKTVAPAITEREAVGLAFCFGCDHAWEAVAPVGTTQLECPRCGALKGLWKFPFQLPPGSLERVCNCGNNLFYISPDGHMCANCGTYQSY